MSTIHFIGGEKGGVGKSVVARLLAQYCIDRQRPMAVFDADLSHGAMTRYYADFATSVDLSRFDQADAIASLACEQADAPLEIIVDLAAQTQAPLRRWLEQSGVFELGRELGFGTTMWHVMDDGTDSVALLAQLLAVYGDDPDYVLVRNLGRGADFSLLMESEAFAEATNRGARVIDLPPLHAGTMAKIDHSSASFWAATNDADRNAGAKLGLLERQRAKIWLRHAYQQFDRVLAAQGGNA